jgi:hypothetical protein
MTLGTRARKSPASTLVTPESVDPPGKDDNAPSAGVCRSGEQQPPETPSPNIACDKPLAGSTRSSTSAHDFPCKSPYRHTVMSLLVTAESFGRSIHQVSSVDE